MKKTLATISTAMITATACIGQASAYMYGDPQLDKAIYMSENLVSEGSYYDFWYHFIDENGIYGCYEQYPTKQVFVVMEKGVELTVDDSRLYVEKYNEASLSDRFESGHGPYCGKLSLVDCNGELEGDVYNVYNFAAYEDAVEYCKKIAKADGVKAAYLTNYACVLPIVPAMRTDELVDGASETDMGEFQPETLFTTYLMFESEEAAASFDVSSVENLEENLSAISVYGVDCAFQLKEEAHGAIHAQILNDLEKREDIKLVDLYGASLEMPSESYSLLESVFEIGDVNRDEEINLYDAVEIAQSLMGKVLTNEQNLLGDVNEDEIVNLYDAIEIARTLM